MKNLSNFLAASYSEFCDRFGYYGLQSLLVIYLMHRFGLTAKNSYLLSGAYASLTFASCIAGGAVADKLLTQFISVLCGAIFMLIGSFALLFPEGIHWVYGGISLFIVGVGLIKPGTSCLIGLIYKDHPTLKDKAFIYFYMIGNAGSIMGPIMYGIGISAHIYGLGFVFNIISLLLNLILLFKYSKQLSQLEEARNHKFKFAALFIMSIFAVVYLIISGIVPLYALLLFTLGICFVLVWLFYKRSIKSRGYLIDLYPPIIISIGFFALYLQMYSTVTVFILQKLDTVVYGFKIPVTWFSSMESIFLLGMAPLLSLIWEQLSKRNVVVKPISKLYFGLIATSVAFMMYAFSSLVAEAHNQLAIIPLVLAAIFLSIGELCVIPVSLLWISSNTSVKYKGMYMGIYYFSLSISGSLSGFLARLSSLMSKSSFTLFFLYLAIAASALVVITFVLARILRSKNNLYT